MSNSRATPDLTPPCIPKVHGCSDRITHVPPIYLGGLNLLPQNVARPEQPLWLITRRRPEWTPRVLGTVPGGVVPSPR